VLSLEFSPTPRRPLRVLALAAHADDIEIGAGGALLTLQQQTPVIASALVFSANATRRAEAEHAAELLYRDARDWTLVVKDFDENLFPGQIAALKSELAAVRSFEPDVIFAPALHDRHQDHRTLAELAWQGFRDHAVLQYEIPKWEGDLTTPNAYIALDDEILDEKVRIISEAFVTQRDKPWFDAATFSGLARLRGVECGQRWAEGFRADKLLLAGATTTQEEE